jgi:hypothetical protein
MGGTRSRPTHPANAFDPDDGGVAAENFSPRARRVRTNEPLSLMYSNRRPDSVGLVPSIDLGAEVVWSIRHCASPICSAPLYGYPRPRERRFEFHAATWCRRALDEGLLS